MVVTQKCRRCGWVGPRSDRVVCPACAGGLDIEGFAEEGPGQGIADRVDIALVSRGGQVDAERHHDNHPAGEIRTAIDRGGPLRIYRQDVARVPNLEWERSVAEAFLRAHNHRHGTTLRLRPKLVEDGDITDQYLVDADDQPVERLQIRRLDDAEAEALGRDQLFDAERTFAQIDAAIVNAIEEKRAVDAGVKATHHLVLAVGHPLGRIVREHIEVQRFDLAGYAAVWIQGRDEEPVQLSSL